MSAPVHAQWAFDEPQEPHEPPAWHKQQHSAPQLRAWALGSAGQLAGAGSYLGASVALGYESQFPVHPTINEVFFGSAFAAEVRAHGCERTDESSAWLVMVGAAFAAHVLSKDDHTLPRWRIASVFGVLVPEIGVAFRDDHRASPYTRWSVPVGWLTSPALSLEVAPSVSMLYSTASGTTELLWQIGFGGAWRQLGVLPRPI